MSKIAINPIIYRHFWTDAQVAHTTVYDKLEYKC